MVQKLSVLISYAYAGPSLCLPRHCRLSLLSMFRVTNATDVVELAMICPNNDEQHYLPNQIVIFLYPQPQNHSHCTRQRAFLSAPDDSQFARLGQTHFGSQSIKLLRICHLSWVLRRQCCTNFRDTIRKVEQNHGETTCIHLFGYLCPLHLTHIRKVPSISTRGACGVALIRTESHIRVVVQQICMQAADATRRSNEWVYTCVNH